MLSAFSLMGIRAYQTWISPYKGYRCAYSLLHGGTGCSGFAKQEIRLHGIRRALPKIRSRFADCRLALETLQKSGNDTSSDPEKKKAESRCDTFFRYSDVDCCPGNCCDF